MSTEGDVKVIVVGCSMGGMLALQVILRGLGADFPLPIAVVLHRASEWEGPSLLAPLLQRHSALPVVEAGDKDAMVGGRVYIAPADYHLLVDDGMLALSVDARVMHARPSIDVLFESAAEAYRDGVLGVILTGASADGTAGAQQIKRRGGTVIAQDPAKAESPVMPRAAITAGVVDRVLPLEEIAPFLNVAAVTHR